MPGTDGLLPSQLVHHDPVELLCSKLLLLGLPHLNSDVSLQPLFAPLPNLRTYLDLSQSTTNKAFKNIPRTSVVGWVSPQIQVLLEAAVGSSIVECTAPHFTQVWGQGTPRTAQSSGCHSGGLHTPLVSTSHAGRQPAPSSGRPNHSGLATSPCPTQCEGANGQQQS